MTQDEESPCVCLNSWCVGISTEGIKRVGKKVQTKRINLAVYGLPMTRSCHSYVRQFSFPDRPLLSWLEDAVLPGEQPDAPQLSSGQQPTA